MKFAVKDMFGTKKRKIGEKKIDKKENKFFYLVYKRIFFKKKRENL